MLKAKPGHFGKECKANSGSQKAMESGNKQSRLCPRCRREKYWVNECHSRTDINDNPIPPRQGSFKRGQPRSHQVEGTVFSTLLQPFQPTQSQSQLSKHPDPQNPQGTAYLIWVPEQDVHQCRGPRKAPCPSVQETELQQTRR